MTGPERDHYLTKIDDATARELGHARSTVMLLALIAKILLHLTTRNP